MLYRFREAQKIEAGLMRHPDQPAPEPEACDRLPIAEQCRKELLREISKKISRIQDKGLDEPVLRKVNEEINEMVQKKYAWDRRILELGGVERRRIQVADPLGFDTPSIDGFFYFGRAKELPEAQAVLRPHKEDPSVLTKDRDALKAKVNEAYYGLGEADNEALLAAELAAERELAAAEEPLLDWITGLPTRLPTGLSLSKTIAPADDHGIPTPEQVKQYLVAKRKEALLRRLDKV